MAIVTGKRVSEEEETPFALNEMATSCHPKRNGGKYPMWIRVEYTNGEHRPPHAHLYKPDQKPSKNSLITKFKISERAPTKPADIEVMPGKPEVPFDYAWMIIRWAKDKNKFGTNNWVMLRTDWDNFAESLN